MNFEKCQNCTPDQWQPIAIDDLRREVQAAGYPVDAMIDLIVIDPKAMIETPTARYRKHVPEQPRDWAKS